MLVTVARHGDQGKPRPALVIQADLFSDFSGITVLPTTGTPIDAPLLRIAVELSLSPDHRFKLMAPFETKFVVQAGIGDDGARGALVQAELRKILPVLFQVRDAVIQVDASGLEEAIEGVTCLEAEHVPQIRQRQPPSPILLDCKGLQGAPREVALAGRLKPAGEFVGNGEGDVHIVRSDISGSITRASRAASGQLP